MTDKWQQIDQITMSLQAAELRLAGMQSQPMFALSCHLVTIARGQCQMQLFCGDESTGADNSSIGDIVIEMSRPVMRACVYTPPPLFNTLSRRLFSSTPRPIQFTLTLAAKLAVSLEGDLRIDAEEKVDILDIAATIPLR
jgi:hypothetical protein